MENVMVPVLIAAISTSAFVGICLFVLIAYFDKGSSVENWFGPVKPRPGAVVFMVLAALGFLVCMHQGSMSLLFWISDRPRGDEGIGIRSGIAASFTFFVGIGLMGLVVGYLIDRPKLKNAEILATETEKLILKVRTGADAERFALEYETLAKGIPRPELPSSDWYYSVDGRMASTYRRLADLARAQGQFVKDSRHQESV